MAASTLCRVGLGLLVVSSRAQAQTAEGPYGGTAAPIPGVIEAEEFDYGGEGVAYSDSTTANIQKDFRLDEAVDVHALDGGGYNIGYITVGEYLRYTVDVTANVYAFDFNFVVSSDQTTGSFRIVSGGGGCDDYTIDLSGVVTVPDTGGWQEYVNLEVFSQGDGSLAAGPAYIWLCALTETFHIDSFTILASSYADQAYGGVPATVPGLIEAEEFDYGGEGVGYSDSTIKNIQGAFRPDEAVDIHALVVGYNIGYITIGEYLRYTVDVTEDVDTFNFNFVVSSDKATGSFRIVSGGTGCDDFTADLSGVVTVPNTGGWQEYEDLAVSGQGDGGLGVGSAYIWLCAITAGFNIDSFTMAASPERDQAYGGVPATIPGLVEAEEFDYGGEGVGYSDSTAYNIQGAFRPDEAVDIHALKVGYNIGYITIGEFLRYTVDVTEDVDAFNFNFVVSSDQATGSFRIVSGGTGCDKFATDLSGVVTVPNTGGWQEYEHLAVSGQGDGGLAAGSAYIWLCALSETFNIDSFTMERESPSAAYGGNPATVPGLIEAEDFDVGGQGVAYYDTTTTNRGNAFRTDESVDVGSTDDGGYYVGWVKPDEYLHYTVDVSKDLDELGFRFLVAASKSKAGSLRVVTGGTGCEDFTTDLSGLVSVPGAGSSIYNYVYASGTGGLAAGVYVIRLCVVTELFSIDSFSMTEYFG